MGKRSRTKGHSFEREVAQRLRPFYPEARRELEYQIGGQGIDIANTGPFKVQCKKHKAYVSVSTIEEIKAAREIGEIPVLVTEGDRKPAMAVLHFDDFLSLLYHFPR